jgi:hypothetical protein
MGRKTKVILQPIKFRKKDHVAILNPSNPEVDEIVRELKGIEWSTGYRLWHMPLNEETVDEITDALKDVASIDTSAFNDFEFEEKVEKPERRKRFKTNKPTEEQAEKLKAFEKEFLKKGYKASTLKVYLSMLNVFFGWLNPKSDVDVTRADIDEFIAAYIKENKFTGNYRRLLTNAMRRYFGYIGNKELAKPTAKHYTG